MNIGLDTRFYFKRGAVQPKLAYAKMRIVFEPGVSEELKATILEMIKAEKKSKIHNSIIDNQRYDQREI